MNAVMSHEHSNLSGCFTVCLQEFLLPPGWRATLPPQDHRWVGEALFEPHPKTGAPRLRQCSLQVWYYPQQPVPRTNLPPAQEPYFAAPLLTWNVDAPSHMECPAHLPTPGVSRPPAERPRPAGGWCQHLPPHPACAVPPGVLQPRGRVPRVLQVLPEGGQLVAGAGQPGRPAATDQRPYPTNVYTNVYRY